MVAHSPQPSPSESATSSAARMGFVSCQNHPEPSHKQQICVLSLMSKIFKKKWKKDHFGEKVFERVFVQLARFDLLLGEPSNAVCNYRPVTAKLEDYDG